MAVEPIDSPDTDTGTDFDPNPDTDAHSDLIDGTDTDPLTTMGIRLIQWHYYIQICTMDRNLAKHSR